MPNEGLVTAPEEEPQGRNPEESGPQRRAASSDRFSLPNEEIPVVALRQNVDQIVVRVTHDKLQGHLESYARGTEFRSGRRIAVVEATASVGLALALGVPLFTATFSDLGPIPAEVLRPTCGVLSVICLMFAVARYWRWLRTSRTGTPDHVAVSAALEAIESDRDFPASS